jgi:hypothetical protein
MFPANHPEISQLLEPPGQIANCPGHFRFARGVSDSLNRSPSFLARANNMKFNQHWAVATTAIHRHLSTAATTMEYNNGSHIGKFKISALRPSASRLGPTWGQSLRQAISLVKFSRKII